MRVGISRSNDGSRIHPIRPGRTNLRKKDLPLKGNLPPAAAIHPVKVSRRIGGKLAVAVPTLRFAINYRLGFKERSFGRIP
jgi:hypothetical protein